MIVPRPNLILAACAAGVGEDGSDGRAAGKLRSDGGRAEDVGPPRGGQGWRKSASAGCGRERSAGAEQVERQRPVPASKEKHGSYPPPHRLAARRSRPVA